MRGYSYRKIKLSRRRNEQYLRGRQLKEKQNMEITIGKQKQELNFGVRFVNELDNVIGVKRDGISLGFGLTKSIPALQAYDTAVLAQVLYCATFPNSPRASLESIYDFIDNPDTDIEGLFKEVNKELKKANAVKLALKNMKA